MLHPSVAPEFRAASSVYPEPQRHFFHVLLDRLQTDASLPPAAAALASLDADQGSPIEWSEEDVVLLHWRLLKEISRLADPETPLEEKIETLDWALTSPSNDHLPFSFASCVRVVGTSPMSPTPYFGLIQVDEIRAWLRTNSRRWIDATIARYPDWVQSLIRAQPDWVAKQLARNPQWVNEQIKARQATQQDDLFAACDAGLPSQVPS